MLELRKNTGKEEVRARDLFYGLWIPDLFMRRVEEDADWTLMCPAICPGKCCPGVQSSCVFVCLFVGLFVCLFVCWFVCLFQEYLHFTLFF